MSGYSIPNVVAPHPRGDRIMDVYSHLLSERVVYLGTAIDAGVANVLIAQQRGRDFVYLVDFGIVRGVAGRSEWEPTPVGTAAARGRKASPHRGEGLTESSVRPSRRSTARARLAAGAPSSGLAVALDDPGRGGQVTEAHRAARVQLLGRDADLRPEAELAAYLKPRDWV